MKIFDHSYRNLSSLIFLTLVACAASGCLEPVPLTPTAMGVDGDAPPGQGQNDDTLGPVGPTDSSINNDSTPGEGHDNDLGGVDPDPLNADGGTMGDDQGIEDIGCIPGTEICNGEDDDCNGLVDDVAGLGEACTVGQGDCEVSGRYVCVDERTELICDAEPQGPIDEVCDGSHDEDCDGLSDEGCECIPADTRACGTDVGACTAGVQRCVNGRFINECEGEVQATDETCNGTDDDCDGLTDEAIADEPTECGVGACFRRGSRVCRAGMVVDECMPGRPENQDGCDGRDSDCDERIDEDFAPQETTCGVGQCRAQGRLTCEDGAESDSCVPGVPANNDLCDGLDNDCDGRFDEDHVPEATRCGSGLCEAQGERICDGGQVVDTCRPGAPGGADQCDGNDNDCDGRIDEDFAPRDTICGVGACQAQGRETCESGRLEDSCQPAEPSNSDGCDGSDNDCDGETDEDFVSSVTMCGIGECRAQGQRQCVAGVIVDDCAPRDAGTDNQCDGRDNDCDGETDEHHVPRALFCGTGQCRVEGQRRCVEGQLQESCEPGEPAEVDPCDGQDNDCDGTTDENFASSPTACGVGRCEAIGATECRAGEVFNTCAPGQAAEEDCNGLDDDCDGETDEGLNALEACQTTVPQCPVGTLRCLDGEEFCIPNFDRCGGLQGR